MNANEIANEVQAQVLHAVEFVQSGVGSTIEWVTDHADTLPESAARLASRLPEATPYIDRGFETAEQWLRTQHDFATKIATALKPQQSA